MSTKQEIEKLSTEISLIEVNKGIKIRFTNVNYKKNPIPTTDVGLVTSNDLRVNLFNLYFPTQKLKREREKKV